MEGGDSGGLEEPHEGTEVEIDGVEDFLGSGQEAGSRARCRAVWADHDLSPAAAAHDEVPKVTEKGARVDRSAFGANDASLPAPSPATRSLVRSHV